MRHHGRTLLLGLALAGAALTAPALADSKDDELDPRQKLVARTLAEIEVGEALAYRRLLVYPLLLPEKVDRPAPPMVSGPQFEKTSMEESTPLGSTYVEITNRIDEMSLLLSGRLYGRSGAERALGRTLLVPGGAQVIVPAVPERRFGLLERTDDLAPPLLRSTLHREDADSLWIDRSRWIASWLPMSTPHGQVTPLYADKNFRDRWAQIRDRLLLMPGRAGGRMVGYALADEDGAFWVEILDAPHLLESNWEALARAAVLQGLIDEARVFFATRDAHFLPPSRGMAVRIRSDLNAALAEVPREPIRREEAFGMGSELEIGGARTQFTGYALVFGGRPVHLYVHAPKAMQFQPTPPTAGTPQRPENDVTDTNKWKRDHGKRDAPGGAGDGQRPR